MPADCCHRSGSRTGRLRPAWPDAIRLRGLKVVYGGDAVTGAHGRKAEDFINRVRDRGVDPLAARVSANSQAAEAPSTAGAFGSIAPGLQADMIALDGDPAPRNLQGRGCGLPEHRTRGNARLCRRPPSDSVSPRLAPTRSTRKRCPSGRAESGWVAHRIPVIPKSFSAMWSATRIACAAMVSAGLTAADEGKNEASTTNRFS
jgi:hypothetical protein